MVAAGVLLACLGGLGAGAAWSQATEASQVVVMARAVERGEVVEVADLATTTIGSAPGVTTLSADRLAAVIGKQALTDLPAGSLLGAGSVGDPAPSDGAVLGLRLAAGRLPQQAMPAGTAVLIVPVPSSQAGQQDTTEPAGPPVEATVVTAPQPLQDGASWVVDVQVAEASAVAVAGLAASDRVVLVKKPRS